MEMQPVFGIGAQTLKEKKNQMFIRYDTKQERMKSEEGRGKESCLGTIMF